MKVACIYLIWHRDRSHIFTEAMNIHVYDTVGLADSIELFLDEK